MCTWQEYFHPAEEMRRLSAWRRHYMAKGASRFKASQCAYKKRGGNTWPPKP